MKEAKRVYKQLGQHLVGVTKKYFFTHPKLLNRLTVAFMFGLVSLSFGLDSLHAKKDKLTHFWALCCNDFINL